MSNQEPSTTDQDQDVTLKEARYVLVTQKPLGAFTVALYADHEYADMVLAQTFERAKGYSSRIFSDAEERL